MTKEDAGMTKEDAGMPTLFPVIPAFFRHSREGGNPGDDALAYFSLIQTIDVGGRGAGRPPPAGGATFAGSGTGPRLFRT